MCYRTGSSTDRRGGLLVLDRERHTIAFTYFTGDCYLGGYGQAIAKSLAAMDAATPFGQQAQPSQCGTHIRGQLARLPPKTDIIYTLFPATAPSIVCVRAHASQIARLLADLKGDAREVDSHVRLEDDANCLEDEGLKYVYIVRECAMYTRYTHDVYISLRPSPLWALS